MGARRELETHVDDGGAQMSVARSHAESRLATREADASSDTDRARVVEPPRSGTTVAEPCFYGFWRLIAAEDAWLTKSRPTATAKRPLQIKTKLGDADEPCVSFTNRDRFGIALSGGGLRSATFNLGVLQALGARDLLKHVDYISTVSGGGYIGAFWTALRHVAGTATPSALARTNPKSEEPPEIRHLREFSRFLMPRVGFAHAETWAAIVAVLGGMVPSLMAAAALIALALYVWLLCVASLIKPTPLFAGLLFGTLTLSVHVVTERIWYRTGKAGEVKPSYLFGWPVVAAVFSGLAWAAVRTEWPNADFGLDFLRAPVRRDVATADFGFDFAALGPHIELHSPTAALLWPALVWCAVTGVLLVGRALLSRFQLSSSLDRVAGRCLAPAVIWTLAVLAWQAARLVTARGALGYGATATGAVGACGLFISLRHWLGAKPEETRGSALLRRLLGSIKPILPQMLAGAAVLLLVVGVGVLVQEIGRPLVAGLLVVMTFLLLAGWLFDPARMGLHDFYRARIARCFLGAARAAHSKGRPTLEQRDDEITLGEIRLNPQGPLHLVCCAANNMAGDVLATMYRGARSVAISPVAISLGSVAAQRDELRLSAVATASGAAFNSQMGSVSMRLGPSVAFLMSALNLRLGLWIAHPLNRKRLGWFPGVYLLFEAFGFTRCDPIPKERGKTFVEEVTDVSTADELLASGLSAPPLHLSDGGHFENLGLYELVRRHCRYVIVSDASADRDVAFDDLGNAVRRVREDFGVEIELDVGPLRRGADGLSRQHAVIGTIHYDGFTGTDKGVIFYFKPTLVGDEPTDVTQYRSRTPAFPHEGTADQFYDEAQWESYRRLGEHTVSVALRFLENRRPPKEAGEVDRLFQDASQAWHPTQRDHGEIFLRLTERCSAIETDIREHASAALRAEFFPEITEALGRPVSTVKASAKPAPAPATPNAAMTSREPNTLSDPVQEVRTVYFLMRVAQLMEDVWLAADLGRYWSHPLNDGWMNSFHRWTSTPSFRRWWPLLRPIYSDGFRNFMKERFGLRLKDNFARDEPSGPGAELKLCEVEPDALVGSAREQWDRRYGRFVAKDRRVFTYNLKVESDDAGTLHPIQVGFLAFETKDGIASWRTPDLFVVPSLNGAGIISRFLDAIVKTLKADNLTKARVLFDDELEDASPRESDRIARRDPATRYQRVHTVSFYKSRGFIYTDRPDTLELDF